MEEAEEICSTSSASSTKPERAKLQLSSSPPPNCAICLSDCDNKSFTDRCMHQFCFACLLRWSKVKAECPLCKQPFKSIIHTVRSNSDYEELTVLSASTQNQPPEEFNHEDISVDFETHYYLPTVPPTSRQRRFQYRTTLYLDPHEDIAIQQMLMSHPLTNTLYMPRRRLTRLLGLPRPANSLDFRYAIYQHNWWVNPQSTIDITGRYRDCSPQFFRENPAQRSRIGPWLHRELNALLNENGPHCIYVMSIINNLLLEHHVTSAEFKARIEPYFGDKTDHFIHEFHNFLRSPYDMIGYDRNLQYTQRVQNIILETTSSSSDSDSDVEVVGTQQQSPITIGTPPPSTSPQISLIQQLPASDDIIVLSDTESDNSDVIYRQPTPPPVVTITDSDDDDDDIQATTVLASNNGQSRILFDAFSTSELNQSIDSNAGVNCKKEMSVTENGDNYSINSGSTVQLVKQEDDSAIPSTSKSTPLITTNNTPDIKRESSSGNKRKVKTRDDSDTSDDNYLLVNYNSNIKKSRLTEKIKLKSKFLKRYMSYSSSSSSSSSSNSSWEDDSDSTSTSSSSSVITNSSRCRQQSKRLKRRRTTITSSSSADGESRLRRRRNKNNTPAATAKLSVFRKKRRVRNHSTSSSSDSDQSLRKHRHAKNKRNNCKTRATTSTASSSNRRKRTLSTSSSFNSN